MIRGLVIPGLQRAHLHGRRSRAACVITALCFRGVDVARQPVFRFESGSFLAEAPYLRRHIEDLNWKEKVHELRVAASVSVQIENEATDCNPNLVSQGDIDDQSCSKNDERGPDPWLAACAALAAILFQCAPFFKAAAQESLENPESAEAAARAPSWLVPAVLAFPVVSYVIFNIYRAQVNPYAKVTDWMFGVAAVVIIANLILISTIGVRLY